MNLHRPAHVLIVITVFMITACASGSAIVTGTKRVPIAPEQATLYLERPADFDVIGIVSASSNGGWTEQGSMDYAIVELKKQAAKLGANGVLFESTGNTTADARGGYAKTVQGKAIFVKGK